MTAAAVEAPESIKELASQFVEVTRKSHNIFDTGRSVEDSLLKSVLFRKAQPDGTVTGQQASTGRRGQPFDFEAATQLQLTNAHHSTCIHTKVAACVGLGFTDSLKVVLGDPMSGVPDRRIQQKSKVEKALDPFCDQFFSDVLGDACEDFFEVGNGYMEVVRNDAGAIRGIYHIPAATVFVAIEEGGKNYHYEIIANEGSTQELKWARFGDKQRLVTDLGLKAEEVSEVIHFRKPTSLSRWYGFPDWLSAVPCIELVQCMVQYQYDFFLNRGVPEFMLFILGQKLPPDDWIKIENTLKANIGQGNTHKSLALNLSNKDIRVQLEKLGIEDQPEGGFEQTETSKALTIVTAHRVPPLLAGIQIPGKMGAANEMVNAMMAFQTLVISPAQALFQKTLGSTLGAEKDLKLSHDDFTFRTLLDDIDPARMDTVARMRQELPTANAQGRDVGAGLKQ